MRKLIATFAALVFSAAASAAATPIKHVVFFGDSLTDNGNLYSTFLHIMPKSPPYYSGRFSNGPVWADYLEDYFHSKYGVSSENHAVGGATTVFRNPFAGNLPYEFAEEIHFYFHPLLGHGPTEAETASSLFLIWIGANDYTSGQKDLNGATNEVTDTIMSKVDELVSKGARYFVMINMPDISVSPYGKSINPDLDKNIRDLAIMHNEKLDYRMDQYEHTHPAVKFMRLDSFALLNDVIKNPNFYNQKYNVHLQNLTDSCWTGGYTLHAANKKAEVNALAEELQKSQVNLNDQKFDAKAAAQYVLSNPDLAETYAVEQQYLRGNAKPCDHPETYMFWDKLHPTSVMHSIIAQLVLEKLRDAKLL
jgi:phospholipase/lecithinase/hemolysin